MKDFIELLKFLLGDFWTWAGFVVMIMIIRGDVMRLYKAIIRTTVSIFPGLFKQ